MYDLEQHVQSPRHKANAEKQQKFQNFGNELTTDSLNYAELLGNTGEVYHFSLLSNSGYCYLCECSFNSISHAQSHLNGKSHKKKHAQYQAWIGSHKNTEQSGNQFSARDETEVSRSEMFDTSQDRDRYKVAGMALNNSLKCEVCGMTFTGPESARQHYASEKHRKQVVLMEKRDKGEELPLKCDICNYTFTGQESAEDHFRGKKHQTNIKNKNIQTGKMLTGSNSSTNVKTSKPGLNTMQENEIIAQQNDSVHVSSRQTVVDTGGEYSFKPLQTNTDESPVDSATQLFQYIEENYNNPNDDIHKIQNTSRKSLLKKEVSDSLLIQPVQGQKSNVEDISVKDEVELTVKPVENDNLVNRPFETEAKKLKQRNDDSLLVKPDYDTHYGHTKIGELDADTEMFHSMSEMKIKAETYACNESQHLSYGEFQSSLDTEPVKYVQNDLGQSMAPIGRGRSIFTMFKKQEDHLPRKIENTNKLNNEYINDADRYDASETWKKSTLSDIQVTSKLNIKNNKDSGNESDHSSHNIEHHLNDSNGDQPIVSTSPRGTFHDENDIGRENDPSSQIEEYVFDSSTGRGKCYICDIDFTSSKHKSQHILGKNHLKAREVHRALVKAGETAYSSLICKICSVTFSGPEAKQQHMESEKHKRKEHRHLTGEENDYYCDICRISCTGPESFTQHRLGAQHRKLAGESNADDHDLNTPNYDRTKWYPCEICKCSMNTYEQLKIHERSPKHLKQLEKQMSGDVLSHDRTQWFPCNICKVSMNTYEQLKIHEQSPRHIKQLEKQMACDTQNADRTEWFPCKICNVNMNTLEQLKIHEKSPRHMRQLEKHMESGSVSGHDRTIWYPCNVCNCKMNTQEQLRIHEASPAHIAKQRKCNNVQLMTSPFVPSAHLTDFDSVSPTSPLESFLSEELFPEEFLPQSESMNENGTQTLEDNFQEKLVMNDKPFYMGPQYALITPEQMERGTTNLQGAGGSKRGMGSDLAFATRNRGTRENSNRRVGSDDTNSNDNARPMHCSIGQGFSDRPNENQSTNKKLGPTENNPYAATHRYYCHTCKQPMNTKESYENHIRGRRHMQKVCTEQAPLRCHHDAIKLSEDYMPYTKTHSRNYQQELYKKTMVGNTLCFLPTGL